MSEEELMDIIASVGQENRQGKEANDAVGETLGWLASTSRRRRRHAVASWTALTAVAAVFLVASMLQLFPDPMCSHVVGEHWKHPNATCTNILHTMYNIPQA